MHTPLSFEVVCLSTSKVWYRLHVYHLVGCLIVVIDQYLGLSYEHVVMMTTYIVNELFNVVLTVSVVFAFLSIATLTWILEELGSLSTRVWSQLMWTRYDSEGLLFYFLLFV